MSGLPSDVVIRRATSRDAPALGELGASLMRLHFAFDQLRFMDPGVNRDAEAGYADFLGSQLADDAAIVYVAERQGQVVGYVYAAIEPLSWKELRDECGFIHDLLVTEAVRRSGVGESLLDAAIEWLREQGMPRVVLGTAAENDGARRLFERRGFRPTMVEMTMEL
ncbi:MAG TPA: GNAT family N-acetyltransferase [Vicinamibacterales bacterium]|jgi:GNAT superfamily N-acetyltransferase